MLLVTKEQSVNAYFYVFDHFSYYYVNFAWYSKILTNRLRFISSCVDIIEMTFLKNNSCIYVFAKASPVNVIQDSPRKFEAFASKLLGNLEKIFPLYLSFLLLFTGVPFTVVTTSVG